MVLHYSYLADGTKYAATDANGNGLRYIGPFVYEVSGGNEDGLEDDIGTKVSNASLFTSNNRYRLGGKEEQNFGNFTSSLIDFGARHYDPITCRWSAIDAGIQEFGAFQFVKIIHNMPKKQK